MHVISEKKLLAFWELHRDAKNPLVTSSERPSAPNGRAFRRRSRTLPHADQVGKFTVFNIGGNKYRLIAVIHFNRGKVYVRHVLTHTDYDKEGWKDD